MDDDDEDISKGLEGRIGIVNVGGSDDRDDDVEGDDTDGRVEGC